MMRAERSRRGFPGDGLLESQRRRALFVTLFFCALAPTLAAQEPPKMMLTIQNAIGGSQETRDEYFVANVRGLIFDSSGRLVVADGRDGTIRLFSTSGDLVYVVARRGSGPGEVRQPCCLAFDPEGKLWVRDGGNRRYNSYKLGPTSSQFVSTVRMPSTPHGYLFRIPFDRSGSIVHYTTGFSPPSRFFTIRQILNQSGKVTATDTLPEPPSDSLVTAIVGSKSEGGSGTTVLSQPFGPQPLLAFGPNGETARAISSRYAVGWFDIDGNRRRVLQRQMVGPPVTPEERKEAETQLQRTIDRLKERRSAVSFSGSGAQGAAL